MRLLWLCILNFVFLVTLHARETELIFFQPIVEDEGSLNFKIEGKKNGTCFSQSALARREDAWRCQADGTFYETCFPKPYSKLKEVLCFSAPWSTHATLIHLENALDGHANEQLDMSRSYPWAVELANGLRCLKLKSQDRVDNLAVQYQCQNQTFLLGQIQRCSNDWSMLQKDSAGIEFVYITKAWF